MLGSILILENKSNRRTVRVVGFFWLVGVTAGPIVGFALIFTDFPLIWVNLIGSLIFRPLVPYIALGRTLLYFDLEVRHREEPARRWRDRER